MQDLYNWISDHMNYWVILLFMTIESSFIPFPSEVVMIPAGYLAVANGELSVPLVILIGTLGALLGALINYVLAVWLGRPIVYKFADSKLGHFLLITREGVEKAERYFDAHGAASTFVGRLIPAIRQLISIPAGLARMKMTRFLGFTFLGAAIWNSILVGLGAALGKVYGPDFIIEKVNEYSGYVKLGLVLVVVLGIVWWARAIIHANRKSAHKD